MFTQKKHLAVVLAVLLLSFPSPGSAKKPQKRQRLAVEVTGNTPVLLWRNPTDIAHRDLFYGAGGKEHAPQGEFTFVEEDREGSNPKFDVRDSNGTKWKVKLGNEAQSETAATRLVWAAGFLVMEEYFVPELHVKDMPARLHRGQSLVQSGGIVRNVRLKREMKGYEKAGNWKWKENPFSDTREMNGLRTLLAVINGWDVKDENNAIYRPKPPKPGTDADPNTKKPEESLYLVSDLGAAFGANGMKRQHKTSKNNLKEYQQSEFIGSFDDDSVNFVTPGRPAWQVAVVPWEFFYRLRLRWIGRDIPRADARWMGQLLAQLTPEQIHDAFRAAGYTPEQIEGFSSVVQQRITALNRL